MSITLTNRDAAAITLTAVKTDASGVTFAVAGATPSDNKEWQARFTNARGSSGKARSNLHGVRKLRDANGKVWTLSVDTTVAFENGSPFTIDDIDDMLTWNNSYFDSEATTGDFALGNPKM